MSASKHLGASVLLLLLAGCAAAPRPDAGRDEYSLLPGTIHVVVGAAPAGVVVTALDSHSAAAAAGLRVGDIVLRYNGAVLGTERDFYRLMLESAPGSLARLEVLRDGARLELDVPVAESDTAARG
jgi:S1-C subfamily serine protease